MEKLKQRWGIDNNWQVIVIFIVFAITGSTSVKVGRPFLKWIGVVKEDMSAWVYWPIYIVLSFIFYQILLVTFGWLAGQHKFFWGMEKKMLKRIGLGRFINE